MVDTSQGLAATGPVRAEGMTVFFRMMAGAVGGAAGSLVLFMGILLGGSIIGSFTAGESFGSPLAVFFMLTVLLFASLASSGLSCFLIGLTNTDKYVRISQGLLQILLVNVVIFIMMIPVYFVAKSLDQSYVLLVAGMHFLFSSLTSGIVFETMSTERTQILLGIYSMIISIFTGLLLLIVVFYLATGLTAFFSIPILLWLSVGFIGGCVEYFYYQIYKRSGVDFLSSGSTYEESVATEVDQRAVQELQK